ncbi:Phosphatidylethanolamine-binding -like protein F40A3.3 [Halotydeus destructor]|nr:Phosphatidylethanolamine-binding -like protein F40A3.3 [Halotydeus destructor]
MEFNSYLEDPSANDIRMKFSNEHIVPNVIKKPPTECLAVDFMSGEKAFLGNTISPDCARDPIVKWSTDPNKVYMLGMFDPDVPKGHGQFVHWLVANIGGNRKGTTLAEYLPPSPPDGSKHRYIELLYEQQDIIDDTKLDQRDHFDMQAYAEKHGMTSPVAGNFFLGGLNYY